MSHQEASTSQGASSQPQPSPSSESRYYLLKAEPDSRIVKGKDVKFSVDDLEEVKTSPWEGVRNYEARNIMKEMKLGDKALFYHSNCKEPGIAAFAEVSKEAYPDYTAWDPAHPYFDAKSEQSDPKWYMVDLTLKSRAKHFVPLALLRYISTIQISKDEGEKDDAPVPGLIDEIAYLSRKDVLAIKGMGLVTRGRLSVQRVNQTEWDAINLLAERGGWEGLDPKKLGSGESSGVSKAKAPAKVKAAAKTKGKKRAKDEDGDEDGGKDKGRTKKARTQEKKVEESADVVESAEGSGGARRSSRRIASQAKAR